MKKDIYCNGHYLETCRTQEEAERIMARYIREAKYEIEVEKYTNPMPIYELR